MKRCMIAVLVLCVLLVSCAHAENTVITPDFSGLLTFGMTREEVKAIYTEQAKATGSYMDVETEKTIRFYSESCPFASLWACGFVNDILVYTYTSALNTDYEDRVMPLLREKYGEDGAKAFADDPYLGWSDLLRERFGDPVYTEGNGSVELAQDYGNRLLGLTGETEYYEILGQPGHFKNRANRYEQWILTGEDGQKILVHHLEFIRSNYVVYRYRDSDPEYEHMEGNDVVTNMLQFVPCD